MGEYKVKLTDKAQKDIIGIAKYITEELFDKSVGYPQLNDYANWYNNKRMQGTLGYKKPK
jgi:hypothetical protein